MKTSSWQEGAVAADKKHIELSFGEMGGDLIAVARVAPEAAQHSFRVEFVLAPETRGHTAIMESVRSELDFYLAEKEEDDHWAYAIYHCSSTGNLYGDVHWSYHPSGKPNR